MIQVLIYFIETNDLSIYLFWPDDFPSLILLKVQALTLFFAQIEHKDIEAYS